MSSTEHEDLGFELPAPAKASRGVVAAVLVVGVGGLFAFGYLRRGGGPTDPVAISASAGASATIAKVETITAKPLQSDDALVLPGIARALEETKMYPRVSGYVRRWLADIGDKVKAGQLLAEIDTPELDAQLAQARAQLAQAKASVQQAIAQRTYSQSNSVRYQQLSDQKLVAKATVEQTQAQAASDAATVAAQQANVVAAEANVRRLLDLKSFATVTAPFAGTITTRAIERGTALVGDTVTTPMYTIVATDPIRVFVDVPQTVAPSLHPGADATVTVREFPGRKFPGKITRDAGALDPDLHTMSTEIDVPNADGTLLPGMYVQAQLTLPVPHRVLEIPATALYSDSAGLRVATVDAQNKIHFEKITIERDTGATLWIASGLTGDERIVKIQVPSLSEGDVVDATAAAGEAPAAAAKK